MSHTIVLLQFTSSISTRTYSDFETLSAALDGICQLFEQKLKTAQPSSSALTYDISDLYEFIDGMYDMTCLVAEGEKYSPRDKEWIKKKILEQLKRQAAK